VLRGRRLWSGRAQALHLIRLPLLQELGLLPMLVLDRGLLVRVGALLVQIGVITLLHLVERIALLLVSRLQRGLLTLVVSFCVGWRLWRARHRLRFGQIRLRFGQIPCVHGHGTPGAARGDGV
jgi:hypothetical protein